MAATCAFMCAPPLQVLALSSRQTSQPGVQIRTNEGFAGFSGLSLKRPSGRGRGLHLCYGEGEGEGGSCCGGSGSSGRSGSSGNCGSHGSRQSDVSGIGKEFEALVAKKTMEEFEKDYQTGPMEGTISRDVMEDVMNIYPAAQAKVSKEKFLDIDELLEEAISLSTSGENFIFEADLDEMMV